MTHDVRAVREGVGAAHVIGGERAERRERVVALDAVVAQQPLPRRAEHDRAEMLGAHEHERDPRVRAQRVEQPRAALGDLLAA